MPDVTRTAAVTPGPSAARAPGAWRLPAGLLLGLIVLLASFVLLPRVRESASLVRSFGVVAAGLSAWLVLLLSSARRRTRGFHLEFQPVRRSHVIQAAVQLCIYAYWAAYWDEVGRSAPLILAQLVFLYAFDALLSWSRGRSWRIGFGPLPIILSTNVFIWFRDDWFLLQFLLVATGVLGKEFIRWNREGRSTHVFNPSAFSLGVFSLGLLLTGTTELTWGVEIASAFYRPPHIYLTIFLLGLVVQYFFGTVLITMSTALVLCVLNLTHFANTGVYYFLDTNISAAVFLGFHLLVTDPSTTPRTAPGKFLFGSLYGLAIWALYGVLGELDAPQFYDKLLPIPLLNLCVRRIDRIVGGASFDRLARWLPTLAPRTGNLTCMGCWVVLFAAMLGTGFVEAPHPGSSMAFWRQAFDESRPGAGRRFLQQVRVRMAKDSGPAFNAMGSLLMEGELVPHDPAAALQHYLRAFELGSTRGCRNFVKLFLHSRRQPNDVILDAIRHLEQVSATTTDGQIPFLVGYVYELGVGRPADPLRALEFYGAGCALGDLEACQAFVRNEHSGRDDVDDFVTAVPVLEQGCDSGDSLSCILLAFIHDGKPGPQEDEVRARVYLERASALRAVEDGGAAEPKDGAGDRDRTDDN